MRLRLIFLLFFFSLINQSIAQKLILLFLDGFRWDYIHQTDLRGFRALIKEGLFVRRVTPVFPADCHPNIYSMFTGLYPKHHGVVANKIYSKSLHQEFDHSIAVHRQEVHKWVTAEPLWVTAKKKGKVSFIYHLPVCESSDAALSPSYCVPYYLPDMTIKRLNDTIEAALRSLKSGVSDLAIVYNDEMDRLTHSYGPQSSQLYNDLLPIVDSMILSLIKSIKHTNISFMLVSDHGMAQIAKNRVIDLEMILFTNEIERIINQGGFTGIWPKEGLYDDIHARLLLASQTPNSHFVLYTHESLPAHWNVFNEHLTPPFLLVADSGYFITSDQVTYPEGSDFYESGWHGYAPEATDMASPLLAYGPRIRPGTVIESAHVTDTYQLIASLIGVDPEPNNGSSQYLQSIFTESDVVALSQHSLASKCHCAHSFIIISFVCYIMSK